MMYIALVNWTTGRLIWFSWTYYPDGRGTCSPGTTT